MPDSTTNVEEKMGRILGILDPIPGHIANLFSRIEEEARDRMAGDAELKSDVRSLTELTDRLDKVAQELRKGIGQSWVDTSGNFRALEEKMTNLITTLKDLVRILEVRDGNSVLVKEIRSRLDKLEIQVSSLKSTENTLWRGLKNIALQVLTVLITLFVAYLIFRFGWN